MEAPKQTPAVAQAANQSGNAIATAGGSRARFLDVLASTFDIVLGDDGKAYSRQNVHGNSFVIPVGGRQLNNAIRVLGNREGLTLRKADIAEINEHLQATAETAGQRVRVWYRVAEIDGGVEIDVGDEFHRVVRLAGGKAAVVRSGATSCFVRPGTMLPLAIPADTGEVDLLKKHLNVSDLERLLIVAWLTYTLAHPKVTSSKFVILLLRGEQGSGKTYLSRLLKRLIDPSIGETQAPPTNAEDLAIAAQYAHVLAYDNLRRFTPGMADLLCMASTGGSRATRKLFTDDELQVVRFHVALILNGIHDFIDQPDLAQRCLPITARRIAETDRKSESQLLAAFESDLPAIQRGLYDLAAKVLDKLPEAQITDSERMIDFVRWLGAMELVYDLSPGIYQGAFSHAVKEVQLDTLLDNLLAAAIVEFAEDSCGTNWRGTPTRLLEELNRRADKGTRYSREWPQNPVALSKRIGPLMASLASHGIMIVRHRGKVREISISWKGGY